MGFAAGFLKPFAGAMGAFVLVGWLFSPFWLWHYDRTPTAQPLIGWHWGIFGKRLIDIDWPSNPSRAGALAKAQLAQRLKDDAAAVAAAKAVYVGVIAKQATINRQVSAELAASLQRIRVVHDQQVTEITRHVTPAIDRSYPLPWALIRLHDAFALGFATPEAAGISTPAGRSDADPSPFADSDLAHVLADNYASDRACRAELKSWQDWYGQQSKAWNAGVAALPGAK